MKSLILIFALVCSSMIFGQDYNGEYVSLKTSFKDNFNPKNNFLEESKFNIAIQIDDIESRGIIVIQNTQLPNKLLVYKVIKKNNDITFNKKPIFSYICSTEHLEKSEKTILHFYSNKEGELNLLVSSELSSQMFFNLTLD